MLTTIVENQVKEIIVLVFQWISRAEKESMALESEIILAKDYKLMNSTDTMGRMRFLFPILPRKTSAVQSSHCSFVYSLLLHPCSEFVLWIWCTEGKKGVPQYRSTTPTKDEFHDNHQQERRVIRNDPAGSSMLLFVVTQKDFYQTNQRRRVFLRTRTERMMDDHFNSINDWPEIPISLLLHVTIFSFISQICTPVDWVFITIAPDQQMDAWTREERGHRVCDGE